MNKISNQVKEAIQDAIKLEINGRKFFNHAADVTGLEKGKKMFRFLAEEEVKHMETFGKLFSQILGKFLFLLNYNNVMFFLYHQLRKSLADLPAANHDYFHVIIM